MRRLAGAARRRLRALVAAPAPLLSVVVTGADGPEPEPGALADCLTAVLDATHPALEVLVVGGAPPAPAPRLRHLPGASVDAAIAAAGGRYLTLVSPGERVRRDAWAALVSTLERTGSDVALGAVHDPEEPRAWSAELTAGQRLRQSISGLPLATVDLDPAGKLFRLAAWRAAGARLDPEAGTTPAVLAMLLGGRSFDVLPLLVSERLPGATGVPVAELPRFRPERASARLAALSAALPVAPPGWRELVATHVLPGLYVDAVGAGEGYLEVLRHRLPDLLDGLDLAGVPVGARLGAWSALHGDWHAVALVQDLLADHPHGLPVADGLVLLPDALRDRVPDPWRAITRADRRPRSRVDPWLRLTDGRLLVRGVSFTEYVDAAPLPVVALRSSEGSRHELEVARRADPAANEWADRAWEDRTDAGWEASGDVDPIPAVGERRWTVEVRTGKDVLTAEVRLADERGASLDTELDAVAFDRGTLAVTGRSRASADLHGHLSGPRGDAGAVALRVTGGRVSAELPLRTSAFGETVRLPVGRYGLGLGSAAWAPALLRDPVELVDDRQRVEPAQDDAGPGVLVHPPLRRDERGAYAQQLLRTRAYAAPAPRLDDTVLLETFRGRSVGDNPGAIAVELLSRDLDLDLVWVVDDPSVPVPAGTRAVHRRSTAWYHLLGHARGYVGNAGAPYWFTKPAGQFHLQTWHGTPLKRIGEDRGPGDFSTWRHRRRMAAQAADWDAMVSPSPYCSQILRSAFGYSGPMLETGYPRNDVLCRRPGRTAAAGAGAARPRRRGPGGALRPDVARVPRGPHQQAAVRRPGAADRRDAGHRAAGARALQQHRPAGPVPVPSPDPRRHPLPGRGRPVPGRRRAGHRLLVGDVRLRAHRPAGGSAGARPGPVPRRGARLLLRHRDALARPAGDQHGRGRGRAARRR